MDCSTDGLETLGQYLHINEKDPLRHLELSPALPLLGNPGLGHAQASSSRHTILPALPPTTPLFPLEQCLTPSEAVATAGLAALVRVRQDASRLPGPAICDLDAGSRRAVCRMELVIEGNCQSHRGSPRTPTGRGLKGFGGVLIAAGSRLRDAQVLQRDRRLLRPGRDGECSLWRQVALTRGLRVQVRMDGHCDFGVE